MAYFCPSCWREASQGESVCGRCGAEIRPRWEAKGYRAKLLAAFRHREPTTPIRAAWILGRLKAREAAPALEDLAETSPDLFVWRAAVEALGEIGEPSSAALLRRLSESRPAMWRQAADHARKRLESLRGGDGE